MATLLLLGGYGFTGKLVAPMLLQHTDAELVIAGRDAQKAQRFASELNDVFTGNRVGFKYADAARPATLTAAMAGCDWVLVLSSTSRLAGNVARAALETGTDYYDIQYSPRKVAVLKAFGHEIDRTGACFVTDGGFHPGLPGVLARYAGRTFDVLESAYVGSVIREDWTDVEASDESTAEFVDMLVDYEVACLRDGQWMKTTMYSTSALRTFKFPGPFGKQRCFAMGLEEMRELNVDYPTLKSGGFFVGGFGALVDWVVMPLLMIGQRLSPKHRMEHARLLKRSLRATAKPPFRTLLLLDAKGTRDGHPQRLRIVLSHDSGYWLTAAAVTAAFRQLLTSDTRKPGLWTQARITNPIEMLQDLTRLDVAIRVTDARLDKRALVHA